MSYKIEYSKSAWSFIESQPKAAQKRIISAIHKLPNEGDIKPFKGYPGFYRLRVGDYRIVYRVAHEKLTVWIYKAGNRGDIYKRL